MILLKYQDGKNESSKEIELVYNFHIMWSSEFSGFSILFLQYPQLAFTCSKLTIETLEQGMKYVQS